jgi:hypothetical protein
MILRRQLAMDAGLDPGFRVLLFGRHVLSRQRSRCWVSETTCDNLSSGADTDDSGTENPQLSDTASAVLYAVFAVSGFFAGSINVSDAWRKARVNGIADERDRTSSALG